MLKRLCNSIFALLALCLGAEVLAGEAKGRQVIKKLESFFVQHCYDCHDDDVQKGDLDLVNLSFEPNKTENLAAWERVFDRVKSGEMPPEKKPQPSLDHRKKFLVLLGGPLMDADRSAKIADGRVNVRRLTRREYVFTMYDLLGIDLPLQETLPEDRATHGFETVAEGQQLSHFLLNDYLDTADAALEHAFTRASRGDVDWQKTFTAKDATAHKGGGNFRGPEYRDGRAIAYRHNLQFYGRMMQIRAPEDGWYRVTVQNVQAVNPQKGVVWGTLKSGALSSNEPMMFPIGLIEATPQKKSLTYEAWIRSGHRLELKANDATLKSFKSTSKKGGWVSYEGVDNVKLGSPGIAFTGLSMKRIYPNGDADAVRKNLFGTAKMSDLKKSRGDASRTLVTDLTRRFAERAFRRPLTSDQTQPYVDLALEAMDDSAATPLDALRVGYRAILCSPRFLTFIEKPGKLDDYAVASRLSYAFWNSLPDQRLLDLARQGKLQDRKTVAAETMRLLQDKRSERFITSLTDQWLTLSEIEATSPDRRMFRAWDGIVQESMLQETRAFVKALLLKDLHVRNLVQSDFGMMNERLARHYGLSNAGAKPGKGLQKVNLKGTERGGLVTQGAILKVTANGTTTSPVIRGVWMAERVLGIHIPPPPANVPAVEPDIRGAVSIRDQLKKHNANESCASCHKKIDPSGYALENFDPVGLWRTKYGRHKKAAKIDPSGVTPHGEAFNGLGEWKAIYAKRPDQLTMAFAENLVTYMTGASPRFSDRGELQRIVKQAKENKYGMRSTLLAVVTSDLFLKK
jgi:hypothetical protein